MVCGGQIGVGVCLFLRMLSLRGCSSPYTACTCTGTNRCARSFGTPVTLSYAAFACLIASSPVFFLLVLFVPVVLGTSPDGGHSSMLNALGRIGDQDKFSRHLASVPHTTPAYVLC